MIAISNEDYGKVGRLLRALLNYRDGTLRERENARQATLLLRKWKKREKRSISARKSADDKLYYSAKKSENRHLVGAEIVDSAVLAGWEPSEKALSCWADMVVEAQEYLTKIY